MYFKMFYISTYNETINNFSVFCNKELKKKNDDKILAAYYSYISIYDRWVIASLDYFKVKEAFYQENNLTLQ